MPIISQALNPPGESIDSKLPLEGAIRQAAPLPQQRHHLIHHRDKVHLVSSLLRWLGLHAYALAHHSIDERQCREGSGGMESRE